MLLGRPSCVRERAWESSSRVADGDSPVTTKLCDGSSEEEGGGIDGGFPGAVRSKSGEGMKGNPKLGESSVGSDRSAKNLELSLEGVDSVVECGAGEIESGASLSGAGTSNPGFFRASWAEDCEDGGLGVLDAGVHSGGQLGDFFTALTQGTVGMGVDVAQPHQKLLEGNCTPCNGLKLSYVDRRDEEIIIFEEDVKEERAYWKHALIGYVLGDVERASRAR
ncbi:hypothetical protein Dimus_018046 [Dionaea muscipula]